MTLSRVYLFMKKKEFTSKSTAEVTYIGERYLAKQGILIGSALTASIIILNSNRETSFFSSTSFPYGLWEHSTFKPFGLILFASMRQRRKKSHSFKHSYFPPGFQDTQQLGKQSKLYRRSVEKVYKEQ